MKTFSRISTSFLAVGVFAAVMGFSGPASAQSQCQAFPEVSWWGKMSHERVARYVDKKYNGDWKLYIAKWERQLKSMVDIYDREGTALIKKLDIKLSGNKLENYIINIVKRISVTRCLASEKTGSNRKTSSTASPGRG